MLGLSGCKWKHKNPFPAAIVSKSLNPHYLHSLSHSPISPLHHLSAIWLPLFVSLASPQTAPDTSWNGEPATCGPSVQTVSPCGNILVGRLFMPQFNPQLDFPVSLLDSQPRRAVILFKWDSAPQMDTAEREKPLRAAFISNHPWPRLLLAYHIYSHPVHPCFWPIVIITYLIWKWVNYCVIYLKTFLVTLSVVCYFALCGGEIKQEHWTFLIA